MVCRGVSARQLVLLCLQKSGVEVGTLQVSVCFPSELSRYQNYGCVHVGLNPRKGGQTGALSVEAARDWWGIASYC